MKALQWNDHNDTHIQDWISVIPYQCNALPSWQQLHFTHLCSIVLEHGEKVVNGQEPLRPHWGLHLYVVKIRIPLVSYFHGQKQSQNDSKYLTCWILEPLALTLIFILGTCAISVGHLTMKERLHCSNSLFKTGENVRPEPSEWLAAFLPSPCRVTFELCTALSPNTKFSWKSNIKNPDRDSQKAVNTYL